MSLRRMVAGATAVAAVLVVVHLTSSFTAECSLVRSETSGGPSILLADQIMRRGWPGAAVLRVSLVSATLTFPRQANGRPIPLRSSGSGSYLAEDRLVRIDTTSSRREMTIFMGGDAPVTLFYRCD